MLSAQAVYRIAKARKADITPSRQIWWDDSTIIPGEWRVGHNRPSVLDAVILHCARRVEVYFDAIKSATGWKTDEIIGFQQVMLLGSPVETEDMYLKNFHYWRGVMSGVIVVAKLRGFRGLL